MTPAWTARRWKPTIAVRTVRVGAGEAWLQRRDAAPGEALHRKAGQLSGCGRGSLRRTHDGREGTCRCEGRPWWPSRPGSRPGEGLLPPHMSGIPELTVEQVRRLTLSTSRSRSGCSPSRGSSGHARLPQSRTTSARSGPKSRIRGRNRCRSISREPISVFRTGLCRRSCRRCVSAPFSPVTFKLEGWRGRPPSA